MMNYMKQKILKVRIYYAFHENIQKFLVYLVQFEKPNITESFNKKSID